MLLQQTIKRSTLCTHVGSTKDLEKLEKKGGLKEKLGNLSYADLINVQTRKNRCYLTLQNNIWI